MTEMIEKKKPGRKPGKDNKVPLTIYVEQSVLLKIGEGWLLTGKDKAREEALKAVYNYSNLKAE
jgi:hypothetical protein